MRRVLGIVVVGLCALAPATPAHALPRAQITAAPTAPTQDTTASFAFVATETALLAHFECRVDGGRWATCGSPMRYQGLAPGDHSFEVRLVGVTADGQPDVRHWNILPPLPPPDVPLPLPPVIPPPPPPPAAGCANANASPSEVSGERLADALLCLLAGERRARRLPRLRTNAKLARAASGHALDMLQHRFFGHRSATGNSIADRVRDVGYLRGARHWLVGEALHWGTGDRSSPKAALQEMLASPQHRKIILSRRLRDIGAAAVTYTQAGSGKAAATYVVNMGRRS
jgi:uncharacterized protein YkwD